MIAYVYPADIYGCGFYRLIGPAQALVEQGHDVRIVLPTDRSNSLNGEVDQNGQIVSVTVADDADVVVLQRVTSVQVMQAIPFIRAKGVAVVVDMDDDMSKIDPSNPAFAGLHPSFGRSPLHNWNNAARACDLATLVTVSTPALMAVYARKAPGRVLTNCVPEHYLALPRTEPEATTFGWPGSTHSHPNDLAVVGPAVARLVRGGYAYRGVGPVDDLRQALGLADDPDVSGPVDLDGWAPALSGMGVGMAPLADTEFNRAKSWLKPLELSAVGVPWVASPRDEYQRFVGSTGVGLFAERPNDWFKQLSKLLRSAALREDQSEGGRDLARRHTMEGNAWRWLEAWDQARRVQRATGSIFSKGGIG